MKKCLYCGCELEDESIIDFCEKCGKRAFGEKMLKAIIKNMKNAERKGDLYQGIIGENTKKSENAQDLKIDTNSFKSL